jgi:hypothetical protein
VEISGVFPEIFEMLAAFWDMMMSMESDGRDHSRGSASISWSRVMVAIAVGFVAALVFHHFWPLVSH